MVQKEKIVIGIRDSLLSKAQTREFISNASHSINGIEEDDFSIKYIKTTGDIKNKERLDQLGGKGLFVKEIEEHLLSGEIDIGVHSMKDMPSKDHQSLEIFCFMKRVDNSDVLISNSGKSLYELESGSTVGTSSIRRRSQLLNLRKDLNIKLLRGNVDTRLKKLNNLEYDAIILAFAGLKRLKIQNKITQVLDQKLFLPAGGQGVIGIQSRCNSKYKEIFKTINDENTEIANISERTFLRTINANCNSPVCVYANVENQKLKIRSQIFSHDGELIFFNTMEGDKKECNEIGIRLGRLAIKSLGQKTIDELDILKNDFNYTP